MIMHYLPSDYCPYYDDPDGPNGACEGPVSVIDEVCLEDYSDCWWVYRCEKHSAQYHDNYCFHEDR